MLVPVLLHYFFFFFLKPRIAGSAVASRISSIAGECPTSSFSFPKAFSVLLDGEGKGMEN